LLVVLHATVDNASHSDSSTSFHQPVRHIVIIAFPLRQRWNK